MNRITLYSKPGCHLCDAVKAVIEQVSAAQSLELTVRNILDDPEDLKKYQTEIPVVMLNGREIARYRLSRVKLEYELQQERERSK